MYKTSVFTGSMRSPSPPLILESNGASQISLNSSKPPMCLRILMKSKDRMIVRQEDGRKPVISLTTLLVADSTGFI